MMIVPMDSEHVEVVAAIEAEDGDVHWSRDQFAKELSGEFRRFFVVTDEPPAAQPGARALDVRRSSLDVLAYGGYWKAGPEAQITNLVVRGRSRCRGIGKRLMEFILDCARSEMCVTCTLEVRQSNAHGQSLYKALGFDVKGTRSKIYQNPVEDAVLMEKTL